LFRNFRPKIGEQVVKTINDCYLCALT